MSSSSPEAAETLTLRLSRTVPAARDRVWQAWTDPTELARWLWPARFDTVCTFDVEVGGRFRFSSEPVGMAVSGEVVAVDAPSRLVLTWQWDGDPDVTLVTVELVEAADTTEVVVVHERFTTAEDRDQHGQGWNDCLDRLVAHLPGREQRTPGPRRTAPAPHGRGGPRGIRR